MSWEYRVIAFREGDGDVYLGIYEVYYKDGEMMGFTQNGVSPFGYDIDGLKMDMFRMLECMDKPILDGDNFPNEYIES